MSIQITLSATLVALTLSWTLPALAGPGADQRLIERGRYLVNISGCNDCHTPGYMENGGGTPVDQWLTGTALGWQGPWGTTYPSNLRLLLGHMSEAQWLVHARRETRPPMPWFNLKAMNDADLKAIYRFVRGMGVKGEPAPAYVPPGQKVATPYLDMTPRNLPPQRQAAAR